MSYVQPKEIRKLRACIRCKLLKTESQWLNQQFLCENCGNIPENEITSNFKGFVAYTDPEHSWVSKWLQMKSCIPGMYCISVDNNDNEEEFANDYEDEVGEEQIY